jgi:hypothetical protein
MPRFKLTKSSIDSLNTCIEHDLLGCWLPGLWREGHPEGPQSIRRLYRTGGAGSSLRKYTIGVFGPVTLHQA